MPILGLLLGCPRPPAGPGQTLVEDIRFEGTGRGLFTADSPAALSDVIEQGHTRRLLDVGKLDFGPVIGDAGVLDEGGLPDDGRRLEVWYAHHGYFDARFLGWREEPRRRNHRTGLRRVDLVARLDRGLPSALDAPVQWSGLDELAGPFAAGLRDLAQLDEGDVFELDAYEGTLAAVRERLYERGYAYARVRGRVDARPDEHAVTVHVEVEAGRPCVFGEVSVVGEPLLPAWRVIQELGFEAGDGFKLSKLVSARQRLYSLGVYALVEVQPRLDTPGAREVPVTVRLQRRASRTFAFGPSLELAPGKQELVATAEYRDDDAFHRLLRYRSTLTGGVASAVDPTATLGAGEQLANTLGPVAGLDQSFTVPGLGGGHFVAALAGSGRLGVESGYREFEATGFPSVTWTPDRRIAVTLGYRAKYHQYFDLVDRSALLESKLSVSALPRYVLSALEQTLTWDARDNPLAATRNYFLQVTTTEAGGPFGGDFDFFRVTADARAYRKLRVGDWEPGTVTAGRVGGGVIVPYTVGDDVELDERLFVGGGNSVRGWGEGRLGPHVAVESCDEEGTCVSSWQPVGGLVSAFGSLELRQPLPWSLGMVVFLDAGRAWDKATNVLGSPVQLGVGAGLRYVTAIGALRLDFGVAVITEDQPGWEGQAWTLNLGLGEAF